MSQFSLNSGRGHIMQEQQQQQQQPALQQHQQISYSSDTWYGGGGETQDYYQLRPPPYVQPQLYPVQQPPPPPQQQVQLQQRQQASYQPGAFQYPPVSGEQQPCYYLYQYDNAISSQVACPPATTPAVLTSYTTLTTTTASATTSTATATSTFVEQLPLEKTLFELLTEKSSLLERHDNWVANAADKYAERVQTMTHVLEGQKINIDTKIDQAISIRDTFVSKQHLTVSNY